MPPRSAPIITRARQWRSRTPSSTGRARPAISIRTSTGQGARLTGASRYSVTFKELPPVKGFWSITLYDKYHFFAPNELNRFSLGTKSKGLRFEADGSLIIYVQNEH